MPKYITYELRAEENLKLATTNMQIDSHESMDYVSGSAMRGAYIYKYIIDNNIKDINTGEHREKLLAGQIKFLNAYPMHNGKRGLPLPRCYFAPKQNIKTFDDKIDIYLGLDRHLPAECEKIRLCEFVHMDKNKFTKIKIEKASNLHINKKSEKNKLFRYESIKKNQQFLGIIKVEKDEYIQEVLNLFSDKVVYIGGSKGSGYGRCVIKNMKVLDKNPESMSYSVNNNKKYIYIIALSDIIYRTGNGVYKTKIDEELLEMVLGIDKAEYVDSSIDTNNVTSFNNKWNARTPNVVAIKAGSVFKYKIEGTLDKSKIEVFVDDGIGERKAEGFGRIAITTELEDGQFYADTETADEIKEDIFLTADERELINLIGTRIYNMRVENKTNERVLKLDEQLQRADQLKQWGILKDFFLYLSQIDIEEGRKIYRNYMDHIVGKRGKSYKDMEKVYYITSEGERQRLINFFDDCIENITDRDYFNDMYKDCRVDIAGNENIIDDEFMYRINLKVLSELCRYQIRKGEI